MNRWWGHWPENRLHVDNLSIPGSKVPELQHAFLVDYKGVEASLHVVLSGGLNDVMAGKSAQTIFQEMVSFGDAIVSLNPKNTFSVVTLLLPPMLVKLPCDGIERGKEFIDYKDTIIQLNALILGYRKREQSLKGTCFITGFHHLGLREEKGITGEVTGLPLKNNAFNFPLWRETEPAKMLHGSDTLRRIMGKRINEYFMVLFGLKVSRGTSKVSGLKIEKRLKKRAMAKAKKKSLEKQ